MTVDEAVTDILEILHPPASKRAACRAEVADYVQRMEALRKYEATNHFPQSHLGRVTNALAKLEKEVAALDAAPRELLNVDREIKHIAQRVSALKKRQSAGAAKRYAMPMRRMAVFVAANLVVDWHNKPPSMSRTGPYLKIASVLFEVATGKIGADLERQCQQAISPTRAKAHFFPG
jgi:hypothetical protein